jgi:hypothetical protein
MTLTILQLDLATLTALAEGDLATARLTRQHRCRRTSSAKSAAESGVVVPDGSSRP